MIKKNILRVKDMSRICIATYEYKGFLIELIQEGETVECWLRHPIYGISLFVLAVDMYSDYLVDVGVVKFFERFINQEIEYYIEEYICEYVPELAYENM